ncbi:MAG: hypothetical protein ACHQ5A_07395 [Opitutales bacterium]
MKNLLRLLACAFILTLGSLAFAAETKDAKDCPKDCQEAKTCAKDCQCDKCKAERAEAAKLACKDNKECCKDGSCDKCKAEKAAQPSAQPEKK